MSTVHGRKRHREASGRDGETLSSSSSSKNLRKLSHTLSWALRHTAHDLGLTISEDGYVPVDELLRCTHPKFQGGKWTSDDIRQVVETNDKQRFKLEELPAALFTSSTPPLGETEVDNTRAEVDNTRASGTVLCIRANQGHSIPGINPHLLLSRISSEELVTLETIVHGTYIDPWRSIREQGLSRMKRNHIHFASGMPGENGVISGMRKSCHIYIYINGEKCARDGISFFRSDNGVLLTAGINDCGILPADYFSHVVDSSGKVLLDHRQCGDEETRSEE